MTAPSLDPALDPALARRAWHAIETINAVTYFSPECLQAMDDAGMKGFWMGYFAARAAPLGPVGPGVVEATFVNFHPDRVRRALPDAWSYASPASVVATRQSAAARALRRILGDDVAVQLAASVAPVLADIASQATSSGRPLFAANRDVAQADDPVAWLWQTATTMREHRGDGHVALLVGAGFDACEVLVLFATDTGTDPALFLHSRGWNESDWEAARARLSERGLIGGDGSLTATGRQLRARVESETDALAIAAYRRLGAPGVHALIGELEPAAVVIAAAGDIVFPNPMGLPEVGRPSGGSTS